MNWKKTEIKYTNSKLVLVFSTTLRRGNRRDNRESRLVGCTGSPPLEIVGLIAGTFTLHTVETGNARCRVYKVDCFQVSKYINDPWSFFLLPLCIGFYILLINILSIVASCRVFLLRKFSYNLLLQFCVFIFIPLVHNNQTMLYKIMQNR